MGPLASVNVYAKIVEVAQEKYNATQDTDYPPMFIYNLPLEGFDETGFVDEEKVKGQLLDGVRRLEGAGSDFIIIACNTVHYFLSEMQGAVSIPILSLPDKTAERVEAEGYKKVGLLSSQSTRELGLYRESLGKVGTVVVTASEDEQKTLNTIILHVMSGTHTGTDSQALQKIMERMVHNDGVEAIILGCTELPLVTHKNSIARPIFDTIVIAAEESLAYATQKSDTT